MLRSPLPGGDLGVGLKCLGPLWNSVECFKLRKAVSRESPLKGGLGECF